ncbi:MAG TPA: DUF4239 domain-containing protein [Drouetiella sp.]|jgi:Protein of unknown function (DUF4239)
MNSYIFGLLTVVAATLLAVGGMLIVRRRVGVEALSSYHEVAGYLLSIVGTLYAVLLGFVVVDAMEHTQELRVLVDQEASGLCNIFLCSNGLPSAKRMTIQTLCDQYADSVINDEWQAMQQGKYSVTAFKTVWSLWKEITTYAPVSESEQNLHQQLVSEICTMTQNRRTRIVNSRHGLNPFMWAVLITGAIFTVMFTYFFGVKNIRAQVLMTVLVSLTLWLNVLLVFIFCNPFAGEFAIQPDSFKLDRMIFQNFDKGSPPAP